MAAVTGRTILHADLEGFFQCDGVIGDLRGRLCHRDFMDGQSGDSGADGGLWHIQIYVYWGMIRLITIVLCVVTLQGFGQAPDLARWENEAKNVTIIRDKWGIPHIY